MMNETTSAPSAYEAGRQSVRLWDEQSAGEGVEAANDFDLHFGEDAAAMKEFNCGVAEERGRRNLAA